MLLELQHLVLAAQHGSLTAAARHAHLSQPALTASIQRLEAQVGARLLDRGRSGAKLTAAGAALLPRARAALAAVDEGVRAVQEVMDLGAGEVRLGAGATACTYQLPPVLAAFRARYPGVRFRLRELTTDEAVDALAVGDLDLAVVVHPDAELWIEDPLVLVRAPGHEVDALERAPVVTLRPGASSRAMLDRTWPGANIVMELGGIAAVKAMVAAGIGVALVSEDAVRDDLERGRLAVLEDPNTPLVRRVGLLHRGVARLPPAAAAFREALLGGG